MDRKLEVAVLPVADDDRAKAFYHGPGWRLDADIRIAENHRVVQFTPPGSPASIQCGRGTTTMTPGAVQDLYLITEDIDAARQELISRGADVSEAWHRPGFDNVEKRTPGPDRERTSYRSFATFADPDGNSWLLQETAEHHGAFEKVAPHDWWDWYAAYLDARRRDAQSRDQRR